MANKLMMIYTDCVSRQLIRLIAYNCHMDVLLLIMTLPGHIKVSMKHCNVIRWY